MTRPWTAVLPFVAVALVAAGCGSGSGGSSQSSGSDSAAASGTQGSSQSGTGYAGRYAAPASGTGGASATGPAVVKTRRLTLGTVLVGPNGRTLYLFEKDRGGSSACSGGCAQAWPPLTTTGAPKADAGAQASMLSTIKRADGSTQVTYAGHPLYSFFGDKRPGQDAGQGSKAFGGGWYVVTPAGRKIDES